MVFEKIREIISDETKLSIGEITLDTEIEKDLHLDSLEVFQITIRIEEEFDIEITSNDAKEIKTVGNLVDYVSKNL
ncbi:MAG: acyl carrier protein [Lachnospirales bacterium]